MIEDNALDVKTIQRIFEYESEWHTVFVVVEDGQEAIEYLLHPEMAKPDLVILDVKLPKRDGLDVLLAIRSSEHLFGVRVVY